MARASFPHAQKTLIFTTHTLVTIGMHILIASVPKMYHLYIPSSCHNTNNHLISWLVPLRSQDAPKASSCSTRTPDTTPSEPYNDPKHLKTNINQCKIAMKSITLLKTCYKSNEIITFPNSNLPHVKNNSIHNLQIWMLSLWLCTTLPTKAMPKCHIRVTAHLLHFSHFVTFS